MDFKSMDVKEQIKKTRHKAEKPLKALATIVTFFVYILAALLGFILSNAEGYEQVVSTLEDEETLQIVELVHTLGIASAVLLVGAMAVLFLFAMYKQYAQEMSYAVKVSEKNFPEIYKTACEYSEKLGFKKVPDIYVTQNNGVLNAFATMVPGRKYIQLNSEIVDIAYMENKDFDTVNFVMAHEFGHIYFKHVTLGYHLSVWVFNLIPILGPMLSRAMEYSCDRVAQALTEDTSTKETMLLLTTGRHLYKYADMDDYLESALGKHNFFERLGRFVVNLLASHPIAPYRTKALMDPQRKCGRLL